LSRNQTSNSEKKFLGHDEDMCQKQIKLSDQEIFFFLKEKKLKTKLNFGKKKKKKKDVDFSKSLDLSKYKSQIFIDTTKIDSIKI